MSNPRNRMADYWPILAMAVIIWLTVIWARTVPGNEFSIQRISAILIAAACWFTIGRVYERIRRGREDRRA